MINILLRGNLIENSIIIPVRSQAAAGSKNKTRSTPAAPAKTGGGGGIGFKANIAESLEDAASFTSRAFSATNRLQMFARRFASI